MSGVHSSIKWKAVLAKHLRDRSWRKHFNFIIDTLTIVDRGIKPSFLWDIGPTVTSEVIVNLLTELKSENLIHCFFCVIVIEMDFIITNVHSLSEHFRNSNLIFIDASDHLIYPVGVDRGVTGLIDSIKKIILDQILSLNYSNSSVSLDVSEFCVPSVFGLLIGYPIVYWTDRLSESNNLSSRRLMNVKIALENSDFQKFFEIYSFSYPADLDYCHSHVDSWFIELKNKFPLYTFILTKNIISENCISL